MRVVFVMSFLLTIGCSPIRQNEFDAALSRMLASVDRSASIRAVNGRQLNGISSCLAECASLSGVELPFIGSVGIGRTHRRSAAGQDALSRMEVRWKGIFDMETINRQHRREINFGFTVFMVTSNDAVRVLSFERSRNNGKCRGTQGRYIRYCDESMKLSIWDGILPDRNHPEDLFDEQYKEVLAVLTERPFNYCYYLSPDMIASAIDRMPRQRIYRLVKRTKDDWSFVSDTVLSCSSDGEKQ